MAPKKAAEAGKRKRKKEMILLEDKKEIIRQHEGGMRLTDLAKEYGRSASTIGTILKMKEKITGRDAAKGVTRVSRQRPPVLEEVKKHGEAASSDGAAAEEFATEFLEVFNCDETGLFWKRMPKRTFITEEETSLPGHKLMNDRLTLLFCANASGDLKIKPLLVYHSENPRAFKKHKVNKKQLSVVWQSNPKAWVTHL
ncbi:tigger transposable element-derived 1-like [Pelobates cultripes]|uniref:Tigger transposable element-derived 1-like n=1 Tax=Pelobates cultripes TaxID=61616 RepID=A0AAD1RCW5_PELCU|nr:tigger transposable element-derived 1-like [Pelobates cultripes]